MVNAAYDGSDAEIALVLAAARDLRDEQFHCTVRFVFHPSRLYSGPGKEKVLSDILGDKETLGATLAPELPGGESQSSVRGAWNGAELKPLADAFAERVRDSAEAL